MKDQSWFVAPNSSELTNINAEHPRAKRIVEAQPFTVSLKTVMVAEDLDGYLSGDNDVLIVSGASMAEQPLVKRVHYYEEEVPARTVLKNFLAETLYLCKDYQGSRLHLEIEVLEVDRDPDERKALVSGLTNLVGLLGAAFPQFLPYTMFGSALVTVVEKLISVIQKNEWVLKGAVNLYSLGRMDAPLQTGTYIFFHSDVDGSKYRLEPGFKIVSRSGGPAKASYATFTIEAVKDVSPQFVDAQRAATLLEQLNKGNPNTAKTAFDFLTDTLRGYSNFWDLKRYVELKDKKDRDPNALSEEEKKLMERIAKKEDLKSFLPIIGENVV